MRTSSIDPVTPLNQNDCKAMSYEQFKDAGFKPINSTILQGKNRVYVYFLDGKPYILAPCNVMTEHRVGCCPRKFLAVEPGATDELVLLYQEKDHRGPFYKRIILDGTQMNGRGEHPIDEMICDVTPEKMDLIEKTPLSKQLLLSGFNEIACDQTPFQRPQGSREALIKSLEDDIIMRYATIEKLKQRFSARNLDGIEFLESMKSHAECKNKETKEEIEKLKNEKEWKIKIFTKEVHCNPPKIFTIILQDEELKEILTSIHVSDSQKEIDGTIISASLEERPKSYTEAPYFTLKNGKQEKFEIYCQHRDSTHRDYFVLRRNDSV